ncbi:diguanylate cyclase (GGDEF) domain-containing protein [Ruminococcaceae bacterium YRB3002]|nr:diguanylate cyclase (GGDEF) domain-containing protein [Ruminococcaceae bacterium YRB3002]
MKKVWVYIKDLFFKMINVGLWTSALDVTFVVGIIVFLVTTVLNTLGFLVASSFMGAPLTLIARNMIPSQVALFWFFVMHTVITTVVITTMFVKLFERLIFSPVRDIKQELAGLVKSDLSEYYVSGKISKPFRDPDSAITWEDQVKFYVDAASVEKYMDELTGCFNRKYFTYKLTNYMELQKLSKGMSSTTKVKMYGSDVYAVFMIDIDHFKSVNDVYGHAAGDEVLKAVGKLLRETVGDKGVVVRNGGEEFVIVYSEKYPFDFAPIAEKINQAFRDHIKVPNMGQLKGRDVTCSIGFVKYPFFDGAEGVLPLEKHVDLADMAMYASKQSGRDRWHELVAGRAPTDKVDMGLYVSNLEYGTKRGYYTLRDRNSTDK